MTDRNAYVSHNYDPGDPPEQEYDEEACCWCCDVLPEVPANLTDAEKITDPVYNGFCSTDCKGSYELELAKQQNTTGL